MGKDYTPVRLNHLDDTQAIKKLYWSGKVIEASNDSYFRVLPDARKIKEIEVGFAGTNETIFRFDDGTFAVMKGTIPMKDLERPASRAREKRKMRSVS